MTERTITYPFTGIDREGKKYIFNEEGGKILLVLPDGQQVILQGDELPSLARAFHQYSLELEVRGKTKKVLQTANEVWAWKILFGRERQFTVANVDGIFYESSGWSDFKVVDSEIHYKELPSDSLYMLYPVLANWTSPLSPNRADDLPVSISNNDTK